SQWAALAKEDSPVSLKWMADEARRRGVWIGGSLIAANTDGSLANRFVLFDRSGVQVCQYDKAHLFRPLQEDLFLRAGDRMPPVLEVEGLRLAPAICYDLRFPEMFRRLALQGVDVFLVSSEWPFPRQHALRVMAEARAIENQAFVVLANRIGKDEKSNDFCGGSGIFGPLGPIAEAGESRTIVAADIDPVQLNAMRISFPVMSHRLPGIDHD
ncbi:MAG TPA: nitrilase-related carbon-nitrogen hydrolase, partial [Nitrospira sp.]|nr:nitrilase-related carbon-nitrogen hydrolase [Nitrospira sp.]